MRNAIEVLSEYMELEATDQLFRAASYVISVNLVHGDALSMRDHKGEAIIFAEWGYLGKGKFQRRDFRFDALTQSSAFSEEDSLFAQVGKHEIFSPEKTYPPMTVCKLAELASNGKEQA